MRSYATTLFGRQAFGADEPLHARNAAGDGIAYQSVPDLILDQSLLDQEFG
jgi:hypothetical protein